MWGWSDDVELFVRTAHIRCDILLDVECRYQANVYLFLFVSFYFAMSTYYFVNIVVYYLLYYIFLKIYI